MEGITYTVWQACGILFILLLPFVALKRPLWFPGLVTLGLPTFGWVKLANTVLGQARVIHLIILCGGFILLKNFEKRKLKTRPMPKSPWIADQAPIFLIMILMAMYGLMFMEYLYTGEAFFFYEITDSFVGSLLPCLIVLSHPPREDSFAEILKGIALGAVLAFIPTLADIRVIASFYLPFSGEAEKLEMIQYRDRNTLSYFGNQAAICLLYLSFLNKPGKVLYNKILQILFFLFVALALFNQSRRWFVSLIVFCSLLFFYLYSHSKLSVRRRLGSQTANRGKLTTILFACTASLLIVFSYNKVQRYAVQHMGEELESSFSGPGHTRIDLWKMAQEKFLENPLFGVGLTGYGFISEDVDPKTGNIIARRVGSHNLALEILVQYGIAGGTLFLGFLLAMLASIYRWLRISRNDRFRTEMSLLTIYWLSLFPSVILGGGYPQHLGLLALLPCAMYLMINQEIGVVVNKSVNQAIITPRWGNRVKLQRITRDRNSLALPSSSPQDRSTLDD